MKVEHHFVLLQARNQNDPARLDEQEAFARQLGCSMDSICSVDILRTQLNPEILEGADALLVGGAGEYSVLDREPAIQGFIEFLAHTADGTDLPIFASCFGFQALVLGLGGTVVSDEENAEVGSYTITRTGAAAEDPLFRHLPSQFPAQLGHKDRAETLPECLINLAFSERAPCQAVRYRGKHVYATQFHPELTGDDNRQRFLRYMEQYGRLFGEKEAQARLDSHIPSPDSNRLLRNFVQLCVDNRAEGLSD